jgi:hypothetical protein
MNCKWTREMIIHDILQREAAGLALTVGGERGVPQALYLGGARVFGSWRNAVMAAGIPRERVIPREKWSPAKILLIIRNLSRRRQPLTPAQLERRYGDLIGAARRVFGNWTKAVVAAGVDPVRLQRVPRWTRERIIEAVLTRALRNEPLKARSVENRSLVAAGQRFFGSWTATLQAAGLDPAVYTARRSPMAIGLTASVLVPGVTERDTARPGRTPIRAKRRWSKEAVVAGILARLGEQKGLNTDSVHRNDAGLYRAGIREYGNWRQALLAAGLNPDDHWRAAASRRPVQDDGARHHLSQKSQAFFEVRPDRAT